MKFLIFIFKHRFRRNALNNILKCKKINQTYIIDFSGPLLYLIGKILYFFIKSKKVVFLSCDGLDFLKRESNSINYWLGGTSEKVQEKYKKFRNNFVAAGTIFTDNTKILTFYPTLINRNKINQDFKFVYISENKEITNVKSLKIWREHKDKILDNLEIIDKEHFWDDMIYKKEEITQKVYIDVKSLIRLELVNELIKILDDKLILVGSNWKNIYPHALPSNYSSEYVESIYKGNVCVDFGSKNSSRCIYPRTSKIIESGGLLFQSIHSDSKDIFKELIEKTCFTSLDDMRKKISFFLDNPDKMSDLLIAQQNNFEKNNFNYKTLEQIEDFINL